MSNLTIPGRLTFEIEQHENVFAERESFNLQQPGAVKIIRFGGKTKRLEIVTALAAAFIAAGREQPPILLCFDLAEQILAEEAVSIENDRKKAIAEAAAKLAGSVPPEAVKFPADPGSIVLP